MVRTTLLSRTRLQRKQTAEVQWLAEAVQLDATTGNNLKEPGVWRVRYY